MLPPCCSSRHHGAPVGGGSASAIFCTALKNGCKIGNFKHLRNLNLKIMSSMFSRTLELLHITWTWESLGLKADFNMWHDPRLSKFLHELGYTEDTVIGPREATAIVSAFEERMACSPLLLWLAIITSFPFQYLVCRENRSWTDPPDGPVSANFPKLSLDVNRIRVKKIPENKMKEGFQSCLNSLANRKRIEALYTLNVTAIRHFLNLKHRYGDNEWDFGYQAKLVYELVESLSLKVFGLILRQSVDSVKAEIGYKTAAIGATPALDVYETDEHGNIIAGVVELPSIDAIVDSLAKEKPDNSDSGLNLLFLYMLVNKCLYGVFTDSITYLLVELVGVKRSGEAVSLEVRYYSTKASSTYVSNSKKLSPCAALLTFLGFAFLPGPEKYKERVEQVFGDIRKWAEKRYVDCLFGMQIAERNHELFRTIVLAVNPTYLPINTDHKQITYNTPEDRRLQYDTYADSQVFLIPSSKFGDCVPHKSGDVVAKVFDLSPWYQVERKEKWPELEEHVEIVLTLELAMYNRIYEYNSLVGPGNDMTINVVKVYQITLCSFWLDKERNAKSRLAAGATIIMERLERKPESVEDFRKGLDQLIRLTAAGIVRSMAMEYMLMRKGSNQDDEFVFIGYGWSEFLPFKEHWMQIDRRHYRSLDKFLNIMEDTIPGQFSRYRMKEFFKKSVKELRKRMRARPACGEERARKRVHS